MTQTNNWERKLDDILKDFGDDNYSAIDSIKNVKVLKKFFREQITLAKQEERKRIVEEIEKEKTNQMYVGQSILDELINKINI